MSAEKQTIIVLTPALLAFIIFISMTALVILAVSYWYIFREDATVLVTLTAILGGLIGYILKLLLDIIKRG
ncbi:MAG: hypothetical protein QW579_04700 [Desulfurococcaceae archaeon]